MQYEYKHYTAEIIKVTNIAIFKINYKYICTIKIAN